MIFFQTSSIVNGLNHIMGSSNKPRRNHTTSSAQSPLTVLSEDEQFFKETGLMITLHCRPLPTYIIIR